MSSFKLWLGIMVICLLSNVMTFALTGLAFKTGIADKYIQQASITQADQDQLTAMLTAYQVQGKSHE